MNRPEGGPVTQVGGCGNTLTMNIQDLLSTNEHVDASTTRDAAEELETLALAADDVPPKIEDTEMIGAAADLEAEVVDVVSAPEPLPEEQSTASTSQASSFATLVKIFRVY